MKKTCLVLLLVSFCGFPALRAQWALGGNFSPILTATNNRLGSLSGTNLPVRLMTNGTDRIHINENRNFDATYLNSGASYITWLNTNYPAYDVTLGSAAPNGFVGINTGTPRTRLQIQGEQIGTPNTGTGWRPWMRTGLYMNENSNHMYVGMYRHPDGIAHDAMINWGDDMLAPVRTLRINFTQSVLGQTGLMNPDDRDREMASFWPNRNIGFGDFINYTGGAGPQSHLHLHNQFGTSDFIQITHSGTGFTGIDGYEIGMLGTDAALNLQENSHMRFFTNSTSTPLERMRITHLGAPGTPNPGALGTNVARVSITHNPGFPVTPLSLLHLGYNTTGTSGTALDGWRSWMDVGTFISQQSDHVYIGMKRESDARCDAVIGWGNEVSGSSIDNLRFIFTANNTGVSTPTANSQNGQEAGRFTPSCTTCPVNKPSLGIGDFTGAITVGATLDVDGDSRIRSVQQDNTLNQILVRDPGDFGRIKWRDASSLAGTANALANNGCSIDPLNSAQVQWGHDVGTTGAELINNREIPMRDFNVYFLGQSSTQGVNSLGVGHSSSLGNLPARVSVLEDPGGMTVITRAVQGHNHTVAATSLNNTVSFIGTEGIADGPETFNGEYAHVGIRGEATDAPINYGVQGIVAGTGTNIAMLVNAGGRFASIANLGTGTGSNYGVDSYAEGGLIATGTAGFADGSAVNTGIRGIAGNMSATGEYYGGNFRIQFNNPNVTLAYAVYGQAVIQPNYYAGYFNGDVIASNYYTISDAKFKDQVTPIQSSTSLLAQLNPVTYHFKASDFPQLSLDNDIHYGLLAQEVEEVMPTLVNDATAPAQYNGDKKISEALPYKAVNYTELVPLLIAGFQEQQKNIQELQEQLKNVSEQLDQLVPVNNGSTGAEWPDAHQQDILLGNRDMVVLNQNHPNPFAENTSITYYLPQEVKVAQMIFYTHSGQIIRIVDLEERGNSKINVYAGDLSSGMYSYSLMVDGKMHETKRMVKQ